MANMIKELWYGNIIPQEDGIFSKPQFKELLGYTARHRAELEETLRDNFQRKSRKKSRTKVQ